MAVKKATKKTTSTEPIVIVNLDVKQVNRGSQDIQKWRNAMRAAESITNPNRNLLYDLYTDIILDAQLQNVTDTRKRAVTNSEIHFVDENGKTVDEIQDIVNSSMFFEMQADIMDTRFWGYTVLEFYMNDGVLSYELVPRKHVKPEFSIITKTSNDTTGLNYTEEPTSNYLLAAGKPKDLGLYLGVAQYVIYKRGGFGDWSQFAELFGMPFRTGKYDGFNEGERKQLDEALKTMGSAAYAVIPENTDIEITQNNNNGNGEVYEKLKNASDEQISLAILGQTMTTKDGSSKSQATVHAEVAEQVFKDDKKFDINILNDSFRQILLNFGFPANGKFIQVKKDNTPLKERVKIDDIVSKHVFIEDEYWFDTYGISKSENYEANKTAHEAKKAEEAAQRNPVKIPVPKVKTTAVLHVPFSASYNPPVTTGITQFLGLAKNQIPAKQWKKLEAEAKRIANMIFAGTLPDDFLVSETMVEIIAKHLGDAIKAGYGSAASFTAGSADALTIEALETNIFKFSAAKNYQQLLDMNALLTDTDGKRLSKNAFNQGVDKLNINYNRRWQGAEYDTSQASSQMASKWNQFQAEADAVNLLRWKTVGDTRVRVSHQRLDGMTAPANDGIWFKYWPPIDWGDRCDVIQIADETQKRKVPKAATLPTITKGFESNAGATGEIFSKEHPYFKGVPKAAVEKKV